MERVSCEKFTSGKTDRQGNQFFEIKSRIIRFNKPELSTVAGYNDLILDTGEAGMLGAVLFDPEEDVWNWIIALNLEALVDTEKSDFDIQKDIIKTLAHEIRHIFQFRKRGIKFLHGLIRKVSSTACLIIFVAFALLMIMLKTFFFREQASGDLIWAAASYIVIVALISIAFSNLVRLFDPYERDADAFAKEVLKNKSWLNIVSVENISS